MSQLNATDLPRWDLTDFYQSIDDQAILAELAQAEQLAKSFHQRFEATFKSDSWSPTDLVAAIEAYEQVEELMGKLISYAYLNYATHLTDSNVVKFFQMIQEKITAFSTHLIFFTLDLNKIDEAILLQAYGSNESLHHYKPWIESLRLFRPHQLDHNLEQLFHEKSLTSRNAWVRLYDETLASLTFTYENQLLPLAQILDLLSHKESQVRKTAALSLSEGLKQRLPLFAMVTNVLAKDKEIEDTWRQYPHSVAARNLSNQVEDEVVNALVEAVKHNYKNLSHRYYQLKAKCLRVDKLDYWDRNAPLPEAEDKPIAWDEARHIVLEAYQAFSPEMSEIGTRFFTKNWIDVPALASKQSGAFAHPTIPSAHPYILLNYQGKLRDVMTLAHELGHGIHQVLASDLGLFLSSTPLTIAETASVFGEMLTFRSLLQKTTSVSQKRSLIAAKIEDMLNTSVRQIAFFEFEREVHNRRKAGELSVEELNAIWIETQGEALGPWVNLDPALMPYWSYISHFIHAPFYVYAYAFGDCLVNSLYSVYQQGHPDFAAKYLKLLQAGGSKRHHELLAPFNLDARDSEFWQKGLNVIIGLIDEFETLMDA
ncbi:M3 family oligoendopeptidase [Candidatus Paracaedibacter symbiosus]|uniref:M3 family oligoendopeptidase n=1 Tax=Candidatus Paracaedibacter symbiosus TaxID=244582 RepID=UPI0005096854|nr:M3 family oligoendopeptidase [Candidatus Paracaedibacter symbiosus]